MMKFFRKYNRHLLAVFMAGLLVIWLGQAALEDMLKVDQSGAVLATSKYGKITGGDTELAKNQSELLQRLRRMHAVEGQLPPALSWENTFRNPGAAPGDQLDVIDWILMKREAQAMGVSISTTQAKRQLIGRLRTNEKNIEQVAAIVGVIPDRFYEAFADVLTVERSVLMFQRAAMPSEMTLRRTAKNALEQASIELIKIPASVFVDSEQTFSDDEIAAQFKEYKDKHAVSGGVEFGYYIEPSIDLQYIRIDPDQVMAGIATSDDSIERQAFRYWQQNKETDQRFRISNEELAKQFKKQQEATSNGLTPPQLSLFVEDFSEAREAAIEAVKTQKGASEANRIATELARKLADPWYDIRVAQTEYQPAPDEVKDIGYYDEIVASVSAAKRHADAVEVGLITDVDQYTLAQTDRVGTARLEMADGRYLPIDALAFNVEGLETIPDDANIDRSLFLSQWQTQVKPLVDEDGAMYLFRVTEFREGREPENVEEVRDRVIADLRLSAAMERAKEAAERIAASDTGGPLEDLWSGETELQDKITPDQGGFSAPPAFARQRKLLEGQSIDIPGIGQASREFVEKVFEVAADAENSKAVTAELPDQAAWAVIKGKSLFPVYEETFASQKNEIRQQIGMLNSRKLIFSEWMSKKKIQERTEFKRSNDA